jgi:inner membrane protein
MDNVTHTITGLMLARAGLDRGVRGTPLMMMLAANGPDIDTVTWLGGTLTYLEHHREYTHALAFAPLVALIPWSLVKFLGRSPLGLVEYLGAVVAVLSHMMFDLTNVYGIRLLLPFSDRWLRLDMTDVVDPWILAILVLSVGAPALVKLVSDEIGGSRNPAPAPKRGWAWFALLSILAYEGARYSSHERALAMLSSHLYGDAPPMRVTALPNRVNPLRWRGVVEGEGFVYEVPVHVRDPFHASGGRIDYPAGASRALDAARQTRAFQVAGRFNQLPFIRLLPETYGMRVEMIDMRFAPLVEPRFVAFAEVEQNGRVRDSGFTFGPFR